MSPEIRQDVWKSAFEALKPWTQVIRGKLPPEKVVFDRAFRAVRAAGIGLHLAGNDATQIAGEITSYIVKNFDPKKRRKSPKTSGEQRAERDRLVVERYEEERSHGFNISTRDLARHFDRSPRQIARVLERHRDNLGQKNEKVEVPASEAASALALLHKIVPPGSKRVIPDRWLSEQLSSDDVWAVIRDLENMVTGWHFYPGTEEIIVSRGRKLTKEEVVHWRRTARPASFVAPKRDLHDHGRRVWADLLAVTAVSEFRATADDWREFLRVVTVTSEELRKLQNWAETLADGTHLDISYLEKMICDSREVLVTRVRKALRLSGNAGDLDAIRARNPPHSRYHSTLAELLYLLDATSSVELHEVLAMWVDICCYEPRIKAGLLPGRKLGDISTFLDAARRSDTDGVYLHDKLAARAEPR